MGSTHTSLHYHVTFSTKDRLPQIVRAWRDDLHGYLGGALKTLDATPVRIGGTADHVHLLMGLRAVHAPADIVREVKKASTLWVRETFDSTFAWQEGYGAFTVSRWDLERISAYVRNQEEHHRVRTFQEEYRAFLEENGIPYDERFLW